MSIEIREVKEVYIVYTNTDLTEGRGGNYPLYICETEATALRLGKGRYVQGGNCPIEKGKAFRIGCGPWYVPGRVMKPNREDILAQRAIDEELQQMNRRKQAIAKAKELGLSDDDIEALGG